MVERVKIYGDILIVYLYGEIDHHTTQIIREQLDTIIARKNIKKVLLNFKKVTFMDSSGIGMILGRYQLLKKKQGKIGVLFLEKNIKKICDISGVFSLIDYFESEKDAIENYRGDLNEFIK